MTCTNLLVHLHHGVGEGMYPSCGTPHRVGGQTVVQDRTKVGAIYRLELIVIRVTARREERVGGGGGEREGRSAWSICQVYFSSISLKFPMISAFLGLKNIMLGYYIISLQMLHLILHAVNYGGHRLIRMSNILLQAYSFVACKQPAALTSYEHLGVRLCSIDMYFVCPIYYIRTGL